MATLDISAQITLHLLNQTAVAFQQVLLSELSAVMTSSCAYLIFPFVSPFLSTAVLLAKSPYKSSSTFHWSIPGSPSTDGHTHTDYSIQTHYPPTQYPPQVHWYSVMCVYCTCVHATSVLCDATLSYNLYTYPYLQLVL